MVNPFWWLPGVGALAFGIVIGWVTYRTVRRAQTTGLSDIATVIGAVGGAAVTSLFNDFTFGAYCIGLFLGFFSYLQTARSLARQAGKEAEVIEWLGDAPHITPAPPSVPAQPGGRPVGPPVVGS